MSPDVWLSVPRCAFCQLAFLSRSSPGLLAGLWEFPSVPLAQGLQEEEQKEALADHLQAWTGRPVAAGGLRLIGEVSLEPEGCDARTLCSAVGNRAWGRRVPLPAVTPPSPALHLGALADSGRLSGS